MNQNAWTWHDWLTLGVAIAAALAAVLASLWSWFALRQARKANALPGVVELFREYRELHDRRQKILDNIESVPHDVPLTRISDDTLRADVLQVSHFLDNFGVLVSEGFVPPRIAAGFMGASAAKIWTVLRPHIEAEREWRRERGDENPEYQRYFEALVATVREVRPGKVAAKLPRVPPDP